MRVKLCGITNTQDAHTCIEAGAWALGFNFYSPSPRSISPEVAKPLLKSLPSSVLKVGIYLHATYESLVQSMDSLGLDLVQLYSPLQAPPAFKKRVIFTLQATQLNQLPPAHELATYGYVLLDAPQGADGLKGGTGRCANWELASTLARDYPLILAGGITADNVKEALQRVNPYAIDVASGIEQAPGIKDPIRIQHLFKECNYD